MRHGETVTEFYERRLCEEWTSVGGRCLGGHFQHPLLPGFTGDSRSAWFYLVRRLQTTIEAVK